MNKKWRNGEFCRLPGMKLLAFTKNNVYNSVRNGSDESYDLKAVTESRWLVRTDAEDKSFHFQSR